MNIAQCLLNRAGASPRAPAVSTSTSTLAFGELADRVLRIAGMLRGSLSLQTADRVVIYMENRPEFFETLFACWAAGLCAVPINAKLHPREVSRIVRDSQARALFTSDGLGDGLVDQIDTVDTVPSIVIAGSRQYERGAQAATVATCCDVTPTDPAWIFYTSGTTGVPKGAVLSHRNLLFMTFAYYADIEQVTSEHSMLHAAPLSHGSGLYGLPHLLGGGHQVITKCFDPTDVLDAFSRFPEVSMFAAPTMITRLVQASNGLSSGAANLRTIVYGGAPMYVNDLLKALELFGPRLFQLYGQGESPMTITGLSKRDHIGDHDNAHLARLASCGIARTGVEVRVVNEAGEVLPAGEPGEIVTRSDCIMAGYWQNEQATAAALEGGWLWTGDIGTLDEAGYLTLRDRSKDLIIKGGANIYPREIEEVLLLHPAVLECSVVGRRHHDWGEEPVAFVVCRPGKLAAAAELEALCLQHIARFKRPSEYRLLDGLPKNNYGKVLKTELRQVLEAEREHA